jgi:hypothetical protein
MANQYHEVITNAQTGEVTEIIRDWTAEELAQQAANQAKPKLTIDELLAQLADIQTQLKDLQGSK